MKVWVWKALIWDWSQSSPTSGRFHTSLQIVKCQMQVHVVHCVLLFTENTQYIYNISSKTYVWVIKLVCFYTETF